LDALRPLLPKDWTVYVQFDHWYASEQLINYARRQKWHVTCGLKPNRKLNDWLKSAIEMAIETGDVELVLQRFLRSETQPV